MATNQQARLPATAEFDENLSKLYNKTLTEVNRYLKQQLGTLKLDINKILLPTTSETENTRVARMFTKKRLKILDTLETLIRSLVTQRNRISLFDMFDQNNPMSKTYKRRYNRVKMTALNRLETGVSLIKFERRQDMPLATVLFPSRNTKLYTVRYELLKHKLLNKVNSGLNHISFVAPSVHKSFRLTKIEKTRADVPIDGFLIPTPNTKFFAARYNLSKHKLLTKVNQGIRNLTFVAPSIHKSFKLTKIEKQRAEVPLDSFLIPTGNTWYYSARYELVKLKLLRKVKKAINNMEFDSAKGSVLDYFMPNNVDGSDISSAISKVLAKSITRESKARAGSVKRTAKANEYAIYKQQSRLDKQLKLDEERNRILMRGFFSGNSSRNTTTMQQDSNGVWSGKTSIMQRALGIAAGHGIVAVFKNPKSLAILKTGLISVANVAGTTFAVTAAGAIGYQVGRVLDEKFGISNAVSNIVGAVQQGGDDRQFIKSIVEPGLASNWRLSKKYRELGGNEDGQSAAERVKIYQESMKSVNMTLAKRRAEFSSLGHIPTQAELMSELSPAQLAGKEPMMMNSGFLPNNYGGGAGSAGNSVSAIQFDQFLSGQSATNAHLKDIRGTTIVAPRANPSENYTQLDTYYPVR